VSSAGFKTLALVLGTEGRVRGEAAIRSITLPMCLPTGGRRWWNGWTSYSSAQVRFTAALVRFGRPKNGPSNG